MDAQLPAITPAADAGGEFAEGQPALAFDDIPNLPESDMCPMTLAHLVQVLEALTPEQRREVIGEALGISGPCGFETDPRDSAALQELRCVIDDELGWHTPEEEEAADYVANVRRMRADLDEMDAARRAEKDRADKAEAERDALRVQVNRLVLERAESRLTDEERHAIAMDEMLERGGQEPESEEENEL